jgi:hypothetical protein
MLFDIANGVKVEIFNITSVAGTNVPVCQTKVMQQPSGKKRIPVP